MFHHIKELQFDARVSRPDPRFAGLLLEQFGGGNGELKAAMQYFVQAFTTRKPYPDKYDLLMDIATEEFSHLEIVGATITMLLDGINGELKDVAGENYLARMARKELDRDNLIQQAMVNPQFLVLSGGGPTLTDSNGVPWQGSYVNANGDLTVDLRSNIAAESRAKIVYEYLMQFTDDPHVKESLSFLMTREISHMQMFTAALLDIEPNFPPGIKQGDPRYTHLYFNMSNGTNTRGSWNEGQGPWPKGQHWEYVDDPVAHVLETQGLMNETVLSADPTVMNKTEQQLSQQRSQEVKQAVGTGEKQWSSYGETRHNGHTRK
jgi:Mn-containing catalase